MLLGQLYRFIENSEAGDKLIILLILLMRDEEVLKKKVWSDMSRRFFWKYRTQIFAFCGYGENGYGIKKMKIEKEYRALFLDCVSCMLKCGIITGCSHWKMARLIDDLFEIGYTPNTVLNKLKEDNPDFEELNNVIYSEKKRINANRDSEN